MCIFISILFNIINAQNNNANDLKLSIQLPKNDTAYVAKLIKVADDLYETNLDSSSRIWNIIVTISNHFIAQKETFPDKQPFYLNSLANAQNNLGYFHKTYQNISIAIEHYQSSLSIFEKINDREGIAAVLNNLSLLYKDQKEDDKALEYLTKALKIQEEINDKTGAAVSLSNIGQFYICKKKYSSAISFFEKSLSIEQSENNRAGEAFVLIDLGQAYLGMEQYSIAIANFKKSLNIFTELKNKKGVAYALNNLAASQFKSENINSAVINGRASLKLSQELNLPDYIKKAARTLHLIYTKQNNYKLALEMHELYIRLRDSLNSDDNRKTILSAEIKYEYNKKVIADSVKLATEKRINSILLKEEQSKKKITLVGLVLVSIFALITFNRFKVSRRQKTIIEKQKVVVEEKQKEILDSISYAKHLQEAILPSEKIWKTYLPESFVLYKPKDIVAGDFYWMEISEDKLLFAAADCTGHGVPGALVSVVCSNALNRAVKEFQLTDPAKILFKVRELVIETFEKSESEVKDGMDISLCCLDKKTNELLWSGANNPIWIIKDNQLIEVTADKQPIGKYAEEKPFTTHGFSLKKGDLLFTFTDGYADQFGGPKGKKFKYKALKELLFNSRQLNMEDIKSELLLVFNNWKNDTEQIDDVCIVGVKIV